LILPGGNRRFRITEEISIQSDASGANEICGARPRAVAEFRQRARQAGHPAMLTEKAIAGRRVTRECSGESMQRGFAGW